MTHRLKRRRINFILRNLEKCICVTIHGCSSNWKSGNFNTSSQITHRNSQWETYDWETLLFASATFKRLVLINLGRRWNCHSYFKVKDRINLKLLYAYQNNSRTPRFIIKSFYQSDALYLYNTRPNFQVGQQNQQFCQLNMEHDRICFWTTRSLLLKGCKCNYLKFLSLCLLVKRNIVKRNIAFFDHYICYK